MNVNRAGLQWQLSGMSNITGGPKLTSGGTLTCVLCFLLSIGCSSETPSSSVVIGGDCSASDNPSLPVDSTLYDRLLIGDIDGDGCVDVGGAGLSSVAAGIDRVPSLVALLNDESQDLTLLAPSNDAFAASSVFIESISTSEELALLKARLRQHIILSNIDATAAMSVLGSPLPTAAGNSLTLLQGEDGSLQIVDAGGRAVTLNEGRAQSASNGTLYPIDTLLAVVDAGDGTEPEGGDEPLVPTIPTNASATDIIRGTPELSEFAALLSENSFDLTLADPINNAFIIIAPSNGYLRIGSSSTTDYLLSHIINLPDLNNLLVPGIYFSTANTAITVGGTTMEPTIDGAPLRLLAEPGTRGGSVYVLDGEIPEQP